MMKRQFILICIFIHAFQLYCQARWTAEKASDWYLKTGGLVGCNYINASSINQLEMWQAESFNAIEIDKELGWAENLGFNSMRVFLHYKLWQQDSTGFKKRIDTYLSIAQKHKISTMLVLFDDCWVDSSSLGKQPDPKLGMHNSGWLRCPGKEFYKDSINLLPVLEQYTKGIIRSFANDNRVTVWDLYNEPGNSGRLTKTLPLLKNIFKWTREMNPLQPITAGIWNTIPQYKQLVQLQMANSDIITFHHYGNMERLLDFLPQFQEKDRPLVCTEYMARTKESLFKTHLTYFKKRNIGAYNWGFVRGKTQTHIPWDDKTSGNEPAIWFHDILKSDGNPYDANETTFLKKLLK